MRLDFEAFTILGPADTVETGGGACVDSFVASAVSKVIPCFLALVALPLLLKTNSDMSAFFFRLQQEHKHQLFVGKTLGSTVSNNQRSSTITGILVYKCTKKNLTQPKPKNPKV